MFRPPPPSLARPRLPRLLRGIAALALTVAAGSAFAATWVDVTPAAGGAWLQLDSDSVAPTDARQFGATWRTGAAPGRSYFLKRGVVDCDGESLQVATSTWVQTDPRQVKSSGAVTDYAAGTRTWQGRTTRLTGAERAEGHEFPSASDPAGRLVQRVCAERNALPTPPPADAAAWQAEWGCATAALAAGSPLCAGDAMAPAPARELGLRLVQAGQACGLSSAQTGRLRAAWVAQAKDCARAGQPCGAPPWQAALAGLGSDLARAAAGQACAYVPEALAHVTDDDAGNAALARFQACVARSIPELDDRVSQADVVAKGVFGACRGELPAEVAQGPAFANGLLPGLTAAVLKYRSAGRVRLPTPPKRSQAQ